MLKIFVAGGFNEERQETLPEEQEFARCIGAEIVGQGHILLNGCKTTFDVAVAEGAHAHLAQTDQDPADRIVAYVLSGREPAHRLGKVRRSQLRDWELGSPRLRIPEPIDSADVVILAGGFQGTHRAANWTRIARTPLLPVTRFGGAAEEIYGEELARFDECYASRVSKIQYETLTDMTLSLPEYAKSVVSLAEQVRTSRSVFVIMSFSDDPHLADAYETYKEICSKFGYICRRVDDEDNVPRILPEIWNRIRQCAFAIVDLSDEKVNVYFELGFAEALDKPLIVTAKVGTVLPFDAKDIPTIFWNNQTGLRENLTKKIAEISNSQGR